MSLGDQYWQNIAFGQPPFQQNAYICSTCGQTHDGDHFCPRPTYQLGSLAGSSLTIKDLHGGTMYSGNRYLVVCNGSITELPEGATVEAAQEKAEALAHQHQSEAFILKPVRKVAPKRDVVTTDL